MSKMVVIGREEEVFAFRVIGAQVIITASAAETQEAIEHLIADHQVSFVLITEEAAQEAGDMLERFRFQHSAPVMTIPTALRAQGLGAESLRQIIDEAVGTDLLGNT